MSPELKRGDGKRIRKGETGVVYSNVGQVIFGKAPEMGIDENLFGVLKAAADQTGLTLYVNSIDTGDHVPDSRHYIGCAADIDQIGVPGGPLTAVSRQNPYAEKLVEYLHGCGFQNHEAGPWPAVLLGAVRSDWNATDVAHEHHAHVSIQRP